MCRLIDSLTRLPYASVIKSNTERTIAFVVGQRRKEESFSILLAASLLALATITPSLAGAPASNMAAAQAGRPGSVQDDRPSAAAGNGIP